MLLNESLFEEWNPDDESSDYLDAMSDKYEEEILEEDFSPSIPKWIRDNNDYIRTLKHSFIDLSRAEFIEMPIPTSIYDINVKDNNNIKLIELRDSSPYSYSRGSFLWIVGVNDDDVYDINGTGRGVAVGKIPFKKLVPFIQNFAIVKKDDKNTSNIPLRDARKEAQKGDINFNREKNSQYSKNQVLGYENGEAILGELKWLTNANYDKSGYYIDQNKLKNKLIELRLKNIDESLNKTNNDLKDLRSKIAEKITNIDFNSENYYQDVKTLQYALGSLAEAIRKFQSLTSNINEITNEDDIDEKTKKERLTYKFKYYMDEIQSYIFDAKKYLSQVVAPSITESLMGKDQTKMFFKIAREIGLETMKDLEDFLNAEQKPGESEFTTMVRYREELGHDFKCADYSKEISQLRKEVDLEDDKEWEIFKKEEILDHEDELSALKRYKKELEDLGCLPIKEKLEEIAVLNPEFNKEEGDYVKIPKLNEGKMSEIDIDIQNAGGKENYIAQLKDEIIDTEDTIKVLNYQIQNVGKGGGFEVEDIPELEEDLEKAEQSLIEKKNILAIVEK